VGNRIVTMARLYKPAGFPHAILALSDRPRRRDVIPARDALAAALVERPTAARFKRVGLRLLGAPAPRVAAVQAT